MREKDVFSNAFLSQPSLLSRLIDSVRDAKREFRQDPVRYLTFAIKGEGVGGHVRIDRLRFGLALALAMYMILLGLSILLSGLGRSPAGPFPGLPITRILIGPGRGPDHPPAGESDKDASGGGGGGRGELRAASLGQPPRFELSEPVIAPTTRPNIEAPSLPFPETLLGAPQPAVETPTGLPIGTPGPPSDGLGSNGGIGTGDNGGVGSGRGPGAGPGSDGGKEGGPYGPGRPRHPADASALSSRPIALNHPRPNYTEEARIQRVQGVVKARVLVDSDGIVKSIQILSGLPDGLDEEAVRAAYKMRFRAAVNDGHPIATWVTLEIEFNLR
jgi:TonB family protein